MKVQAIFTRTTECWRQDRRQMPEYRERDKTTCTAIRGLAARDVVQKKARGSNFGECQRAVPAKSTKCRQNRLSVFAHRYRVTSDAQRMKVQAIFTRTTECWRQDRRQMPEYRERDKTTCTAIRGIGRASCAALEPDTSAHDSRAHDSHDWRRAHAACSSLGVLVARRVLPAQHTAR
jgi:hypothetical protein